MAVVITKEIGGNGEIWNEREKKADSLGEMTLLGAGQFSRTRRKDIIGW